MYKEIPVITIDGLSGSGKGTISTKLAATLVWNFLDSGVLYRVLALAALQQDCRELDVIKKLAMNLAVRIVPGQVQRIFYDGYDVTDAIRHEGCGIYASQLASLPEIREVLLPCQRSFCQAPGLVADGRDMGTVVFPEADVKFFFLATSEARAKRRYQQLQEKGIHVSLDEVRNDLNDRDTRDVKRKVAPLQPADDAVIIDTTKLSIDEVLQKVLHKVYGVLT